MKQQDSRPINRRDFLVSTATLAGVGLPSWGWAAAKPCPPPSLSAAGGTSVSSTCQAGVDQLPVLTLAGGGPGKPWTAGHAFRKGDVPSTHYLTASGPTAFQAEVRNRWPDGSVKFAVLSGIGGASAVLGTTTSAPGGTTLTLAQMRASIGSGSVTVGAATYTLAQLIANSPQREVYAGPVMANWIFRQPLNVGTDLSLWLDVRYYSNGEFELFPWVENAVYQTAAPVNHVATCSVSMGSATNSLGSIDFKARTRIPLLSGASFAYHTSGSEIVPSHDTAYLRATKLVPNYGYALSSSYLDSRTQTYTPNATGQGVSTAMGAAGGEGSINAPNCAAYVASGSDPRAYRAAVVFGMSGGSWSIHLRDANTQEPIRFSAYPNPFLPGITGGTNGSASYSHLPGFAFVPYLITGRWWFLDEILLWSAHTYAANDYRQGSRGIADPTHGYSSRGAAWALNSHALALLAVPDNHPNRTDLIYTWEQNCAFYRTAFVDGGNWPTWDRAAGTAWISPHGFLGAYSASGVTSAYGDPGSVNAWWDATFMQNYQVCVWGVTSDYELPISSSAAADHLAVRNHAYKQVIGRTDSYNWRRFECYDYPFGGDATGLPCETWYSPVQAYAKYLAGHSLSELPMTEGLSIKLHASENDLTANAGGMPYAASAAMGIALAKGHGVAGAEDSWRRVSTASNFRLCFDQYHAQNASYGVVPRF